MRIFAPVNRNNKPKNIKQMKKRQIIGLAVVAVLCAGFVSCGGDDDDEPQNPIENTGNGSSDTGGSNGGGNSGNGGDNGSDPTNPETDEYGIAVSQEVDLGLSVNWAGWNVGATKPWEYGGYYAWGETEEKSDYADYTYKYYDRTTQEYINIGEEISGTEYDVAHVKWGSGWRMPTRREIGELIRNCTLEWISYNGTVNGCKVIGPNGNSIFLPAAGYCSGTSHEGENRYGYYWSGTFGSGCYSYDLNIYDVFDNRVNDDHRYNGQSVRPVREK